MGALLTLTLLSCRVDEPVPLNSKEAELFDITEYHPNGDKMVLGKRLENPYTVENMQRALANLTASGRITEEINIETTDLYVRFLPEDTVELEALQADSTLTLFDYPLDFEIEQVGHWYHDPDLLDSLPTWQYTVVKPDYEFPPVHYEILADLYLVDEDDPESEGGRISTGLWEALEDEALRITGNWEDPITNEGGRTEGRYTPRGRIRVQERIGNSNGGFLPVRYVQVRARRWFKWGKANTSVINGTFYIGKRFRRSPRFSIKWKTYKHRVTNAWGFARTHTGPSQKSDWYFDIPYRSGSDTWAAATMMNAIYHFRTEASRHNLKQAGFFQNVKLRLKFRNGVSHVVKGSLRHGYLTAAITRLFLRNDVMFYVTNGDDTPDIYSTMMHEMGHMSHIFKSPNSFQVTYIGEPMAVESFAYAVEYYFTLPYYPNQVQDFPERREDQINRGGRSWQYTPFFIDLRDAQNQRVGLPNGGVADDYANDEVSGYTLQQMQNALNNRTTLWGVQQYLINHYSNATEGNIAEMRSFYETIKDNKR